jgi:eukaryotic-like serine/threonine-protein kinase
MMSVATCPNDRTFREVLVGDAPFELELEVARHLTECEKCAARMHKALSRQKTRQIIQERGQDRPLAQFISDASKLTASSATVRADDAVEPTLHLPKHPAKALPAEAPAQAEELKPQAVPSAPASIYSFLSPPESKDELGRLGGYRITKLLGAGGMGLVFEAEDLQLQRKIALKVMRPEIASIANAHDRFLREARTMASLEHDHVVAVYQVGEERGIPFLAMPLLQGTSLDAELKKDRAISLSHALRIGVQVATGLAAAHARGLIHRDIKPANIWLETHNNHRVKLLDFGLARGHEEELQLTQSGALLGTPAYMAPEQAAGDDIDARADLFSLGVILYELTTGERPFAGRGAMAILTALALHEPRSPREVKETIPERVSEFIMQLLQKDRERRLATAQEAVKELTSLVRSSGAETSKVTLPAKPR